MRRQSCVDFIELPLPHAEDSCTSSRCQPEKELLRTSCVFDVAELPVPHAEDSCTDNRSQPEREKISDVRLRVKELGFRV